MIHICNYKMILYDTTLKNVQSKISVKSISILCPIRLIIVSSHEKKMNEEADSINSKLERKEKKKRRTTMYGKIERGLQCHICIYRRRRKKDKIVTTNVIIDACISRVEKRLIKIQSRPIMDEDLVNDYRINPRDKHSALYPGEGH